jgi:uncharacterized protein
VSDARWGSALVTGASSGIGAALCHRLAAQGVDLVLVARDREQLDKLAIELGSARHTAELGSAGDTVEVEVLVADLAETTGRRRVEDRIGDAARPLDLVVNNAGFGTYGPFASLDVDGEEREIAVNVAALVRLTHAALVPMLARGRGTVLNVSSVAGLQAKPGNATYGATKAFVSSFGEALAGEVAGTGVTVTTVLPGFTRTEFQQRAGVAGRKIPGPLWQSAEAVAAEALDAARAGKAWHVTGRHNQALVAASALAPRRLKRWLAARATKRL